MVTQVEGTGLAFLASYLATQDIIISVHTGDPGADLSANELATGSQRGYSRHTEAAANWTATGTASDNDNAIDVFTPMAAEAGTVVNHLGIRIGSTVYARMELVAPVTLVTGRPFRLAEGTLDLMLAMTA